MSDTQPWLAMWASLCVIVSDGCWRRVSNRLLLATLTISVMLGVLALAFGSPAHCITHLLGFCLGGGILLPFYAIGWMGAGDVKFLAVIGFVLGWQALLPIWIFGSMLLGLCAAAHLLQPRLAETTGLRIRPLRPGLPYAACLGIATIAVCLFSRIMIPLGMGAG